MEDFVTWVDTSKLKRTIMRYNDEVGAVPACALYSGAYRFRSSTTSTCYNLGSVRTAPRPRVRLAPCLAVFLLFACHPLTRAIALSPLPITFLPPHRASAARRTAHSVVPCYFRGNKGSGVAKLVGVGYSATATRPVLVPLPSHMGHTCAHYDPPYYVVA